MSNKGLLLLGLLGSAVHVIDACMGELKKEARKEADKDVSSVLHAFTSSYPEQVCVAINSEPTCVEDGYHVEYYGDTRILFVTNRFYGCCKTNHGIVAGLIIGLIVAVLLFVGSIVWCCRCCRQGRCCCQQPPRRSAFVPEATPAVPFCTEPQYGQAPPGAPIVTPGAIGVQLPKFDPNTGQQNW